MLEVKLGLDAIGCSSYQLLTSLPPKRHLIFSLEGVTYSMFAPRVRLAQARVHPVLAE